MRKTILIILLAFLGLSLNLNAQSDVEINEDSIKEAKLLALPEVKEFARRVGDTLVLKFDDGTIEKIINIKKPQMVPDENGVMKISFGESENGNSDTTFDCRRTRVTKFFNNGNYLVVETWGTFEFGKVSMINEEFASSCLLFFRKNHTREQICNDPVFSSDNDRYVIYSEIGPCGGDTAKIGIYNALIGNLEFKTESTKWIPSDVKWISNNEIKISRFNLETEKVLSPLYYKFNGTKWVLATAIPAKKPASAMKKKTNK